MQIAEPVNPHQTVPADRPSDRLIKWIIIVMSPLVLAITAHIGMADWNLDDGPEGALSWWPWHVVALRRSVEDVVVEPSAAPDSLSRAQSLLRRSPVAAEAYRAMARAAEIEGRLDAAQALYEAASRHEPRDRMAHAWLVDRFSAQGEYRKALGHLDQLYRLSPKRHQIWMQALESYLAHPEARRATVDWMGETELPWRTRFLQWWIRRPASEPSLEQVLAPLRAAEVPLNAVERTAWIERLLALKRAREAYFLWVEGLHPQASQAIGNVYDGGFELDGPGDSFDWQFRRVAGALISRDATAGAIGARALHIQFLHRRVPFDHVRQRMALIPGEFTLTGRVMLERLDNERGLVWQVQCEAGAVVGQSEPFKGNGKWREFKLSFAVPQSGCNWQWLSLKLDARVPSEQSIGGAVWFDGLVVRQISVTLPLNRELDSVPSEPQTP